MTSLLDGSYAMAALYVSQIAALENMRSSNRSLRHIDLYGLS